MDSNKEISHLLNDLVTSLTLTTAPLLASACELRLVSETLVMIQDRLEWESKGLTKMKSATEMSVNVDYTGTSSPRQHSLLGSSHSNSSKELSASTLDSFAEQWSSCLSIRSAMASKMALDFAESMAKMVSFSFINHYIPVSCSNFIFFFICLASRVLPVPGAVSRAAPGGLSRLQRRSLQY